MRKRVCSMLLLCLLLSLALAGTCLADVLFTPNDDFYTSHYDDCIYYGKNCYANGAEGYVPVYTAPDDGRIQNTLPNGSVYFVSVTYEQDGATWGCIEYTPDDAQSGAFPGVSGWVSMAFMTPVYDSDQFRAEHASELSEQSTEFSLSTSDHAACWAYPGSGKLRSTISGYDDPATTITLSPCFTDSAGRLWGYCGYYYGMRDFWICVSDAANEALEPDENQRTPELIPAASATELSQSPSGGGLATRTIVCCVAVILIALSVLIYMIRRRKMNK